jgi:hypothetical protein
MRAFIAVAAFAFVGCTARPCSGIVVDSSGRPVAHAYVQGWHYSITTDPQALHHREELLVASDTTDESGHFALRTYTNIHKISVSGFYDDQVMPHGMTDIEKPKLTDNRVVLTKNVIYPARSRRSSHH